MTTTETRLRGLIDENLGLGREPNLDGGFSDAGVSSLDAVAFMRLVEREFGIRIPPEDCETINTFRDLIAHVDAKTG